MTYRLHIGHNPYKKFKTRRTRNGVWEALFGGYAFWWRRGAKAKGYPNSYRMSKEVRVWAPANIPDDDCGAGTNEIVRRLLKKVDPLGKREAIIQESWRY